MPQSATHYNWCRNKQNEPKQRQQSNVLITLTYTKQNKYTHKQSQNHEVTLRRKTQSSSLEKFFKTECALTCTNGYYGIKAPKMVPGHKAFSGNRQQGNNSAIRSQQTPRVKPIQRLSPEKATDPCRAKTAVVWSVAVGDRPHRHRHRPLENTY